MTAKRKLAAVPDRPQRVVAYIRVSALMGRAGEDFHSPEVQLAAIRRRTLGMREVEVIDCDIDKTGRHFDRKGIDRVRELAEAGHMDVLAVYNVSRLGRNTLESLKFLNWLADRNITIISAKQHIDTSTPSGRKHLTDLLAGAQMQSEEIGETWSEVIDQRARDGQQHGYGAFGYHKVDKKLVVHPANGPIMAEIFRRWATGTKTLEVAQYYHSRTGKRIDCSNLKAKMRNPVYRGFATSGGETFPGAHPPLVDEETWQLVEARMARDRRVPPRHVNPTWSLVGMIHCAVCNALLQRIPMSRRHGGIREQRLRCGAGSYRQAGGCVGVGMPLLPNVEAAVLARTARHIELLRTDPASRAAALARRASARADIATLERGLTKMRTGRARLRAAWALDEKADDGSYQVAIAELQDAESAIAAELANARQATLIPDPFEVANAAEALLTMWDEMLIAEQGRALRTVIKKITMRKAARWREPEADRLEIDFL